MIDDDKLMEAVRELRAHLNETQVQFAVRIGKSYPTVQRYERNTPPAAKELVPFVYIARESGRMDLARTFKQAILQGIPEEFVKLLREAGPEDNEPTESRTAEAGKQSSLHKRRVH